MTTEIHFFALSKKEKVLDRGENGFYCEDNKIDALVLLHIITNLFYYVLKMFCFVFVWCPCTAINASVQHNGGFLPEIILLTQCYYHRGTRLNAMKRFCICSL